MWIKSLLCHIVLGHKWRPVQIEGSESFLDCQRCGMDEDTLSGGDPENLGRFRALPHGTPFGGGEG
jgi:hypothetical protein